MIESRIMIDVIVSGLSYQQDCSHNQVQDKMRSITNDPLTHLCKVKVHETEREELEADRETVEQPKGKGSQSVGRDKVFEIEGEKHGAQGRPQQAQEQEHSLVAEALVSVPEDQPELDVDEDEEQRVEDGVDHRQAQSDVGRHGRAQGGQRHGPVHQRRLLLLRRGLHALPGPGGGRRGAEGPLPGVLRRTRALGRLTLPAEQQREPQGSNRAVKKRARRNRG